MAQGLALSDGRPRMYSESESEKARSASMPEEEVFDSETDSHLQSQRCCLTLPASVALPWQQLFSQCGRECTVGDDIDVLLTCCRHLRGALKTFVSGFNVEIEEEIRKEMYNLQYRIEHKTLAQGVCTHVGLLSVFRSSVVHRHSTLALRWVLTCLLACLLACGHVAR